MSSCKMCSLAFGFMKHQLHSNSSYVRLLSTTSAHNSRNRMGNKVYNKNTEFKDVVHPGIGRRLKIMKEDMPDIETKKVLDDEDFEGLEADFLNARAMRDYTKRSVKSLKQKGELMTTKHRYFKPAVEPNMLTWSEKKQIKLLHSEDPVEWDVDKLAHSFPATPDVIKKLIKASWKPDSVKRIRTHDEHVIKNWELFKEGKLKINDPLLEEHLKKFTKRQMLPQDPGGIESLQKQLPKPQRTEFSNIIQSYNLLKGSSSKKSLNDKNHATEFCDSQKYITDSSTQNNASLAFHQVNTLCSDSSRDSKPLIVSRKATFTLQKLREEMRKESAKVDIKDVVELDKELLKGVTSIASTTVNPNTEIRIPVDNDFERNHLKNINVNPNIDSSIESSEIIDYENTQKNISFNPTMDLSVKTHDSTDHSLIIQRRQSDISLNRGFKDGNNHLCKNPIKRRIHIPKSKVKVGYLYKVNDSFYSHDGFFLYRVPGKIADDY